MWKLLLGLLLLTGVTTAEESTPKPQVNVTKDESKVNKRYSYRDPQYNQLVYSNRQVLPSQQLIYGNSQNLVNYINGLQQIRVIPYGNIPNYFILPQNNYVQTYPIPNVVPQFQQNIIPNIPQIQIPDNQFVPQQQQVVPQQAAPQQVIPPQIIQAQAISQETLRQQLRPQPQRIIPQTVTPQVYPQQVIQQQVLPQQTLPQPIAPQVVISRVQVPIQTVPKQIVVPASHQRINPAPPNNIPAPITQQSQPHFLTNQINVPWQYQYYQPQQRNVPGNQPYTYEVPTGRALTTSANQVPQPVFSVPRVQNYLYNYPVYLRQSQPQTLHINPFVGAQQIIPIGYNPPQFIQGEVIQDAQPHTVYVNQDLRSPENGQQVVRIGYGHLHPNQEAQGNGNPQQGKVATPSTFNVGPNEKSGYQYGIGERSSRTAEADKKQATTKEAENKT